MIVCSTGHMVQKNKCSRLLCHACPAFCGQYYAVLVLASGGLLLRKTKSRKEGRTTGTQARSRCRKQMRQRNPKKKLRDPVRGFRCLVPMSTGNLILPGLPVVVASQRGGKLSSIANHAKRPNTSQMFHKGQNGQLAICELVMLSVCDTSGPTWVSHRGPGLKKQSLSPPLWV